MSGYTINPFHNANPKPMLGFGANLRQVSSNTTPPETDTVQFGTNAPAKAKGSVKAKTSSTTKAAPNLGAALGQLKDMIASGKMANMINSFPDKEQAAQAMNMMAWMKIAPHLKDPDDAKDQIEALQEQLIDTTPPGLMREVGQWFTNYLSDNVDKPQRLQKSVDLLCQIMVNGGLVQAEKITTLTGTELFKKANSSVQSQLIIESLGPVFIKTLQTLGNMPGLFSDEALESIKPLYENTTPEKFSEIQKIILSELNEDTPIVLDQMNKNPIGVASIAQVHKSITADSEEKIAVKVVKPGTKEAIDEGLALFEPLSLLLQQAAPHIDADRFLNAMKELLLNECDMTLEAKKLDELREAFKGMRNLTVPKPFHDLTTPSVLTMSFIPGQSLEHFTGNRKVTRGYLRIMLDQIFHYGLCQADPHQGNMLYDPKSRQFGFLDAGMVYKTSKSEQRLFSKVLVGFVTGNTDGLVKALVTPEAYKAADKETLKALNEKAEEIVAKQNGFNDILLTVTRIKSAAKDFDLPTQSINPLLWKTLFTALTTAKTVLGVPKEFRFDWLNDRKRLTGLRTKWRQSLPERMLAFKLGMKLFIEDRGFLFHSIRTLINKKLKKINPDCQAADILSSKACLKKASAAMLLD